MATTGIGASGTAAEIRPALAQPRPDTAADAARRPSAVRFGRNLEAWPASRRGGGLPSDQPAPDGIPPGQAATGERPFGAANFTAFLAQTFGQASPSTEVHMASAHRTGAAAYRDTATRTQRPEQSSIEVLSPQFYYIQAIDFTI